MYVREIQPARSSLIEDGKPVQGTWTGAFDEVNLLDIRNPFQFPFPRFIRDSRIKEWESLFVQDDRHIKNLPLPKITGGVYMRFFLARTPRIAPGSISHISQ